MSGFVDPTREVMAVFRDLPLDWPIAMINLLRFRETAAYPEDHAEAGAGHTGAKAYGLYGRAAARPFADAGGTQVWLGKPELTVIGPREEAWDLAFIARYPTGQAFVDNAAFREYTHRSFQAQVLDMETSAIGQVAYANGVPWIAFRSLSDLAGGGEGENEIGTFFRLAADNSARVVRDFLRRWKP